MSKTYNQQEITAILPHRPPMLLIEMGELDGDTSTCRYTVRGDEFFLQGHFPGNPVVPGVILCEMMAQASCLLVEKDGGTFTPYFTGMDKVKFRRKVLPGDCITLKSTLQRHKGVFYFVKCAAYVGDVLCCSGEISFALIQDEELK